MRSDLREHGFLHVRQLAPASTIRRAMAAIDTDLAENYDSARQFEYDSRSYCPNIRADPAITDLLHSDPVRHLLDTLLPFRWLLGRRWGQVAIRRTHRNATAVPPRWHIDGVAAPHNGISGSSLHTYTALVGIFLTSTPGEHSGNFTVWPDGQESLRAWFEERGRSSLRAGMPDVDPGSPHQLLTGSGDVVVMNYLMAHAAAVNISAVERRAVFFRLSLPDLPLRRYARLISPWEGWRQLTRY